jgi:hypothetical protein
MSEFNDAFYASGLVELKTPAREGVRVFSVPDPLADEFSTRQATAFLSVSPDTLDKYVRARILHRRNIAPPGSARPTWRYLVADLQQMKTQGYHLALRQVARASKARARHRPRPRDYSEHLDL